MFGLCLHSRFIKFLMIDLGQAMKTTFDIVCNNWLDEGSRLERNLDVDTEEQEPLTYLYEVVSKSNASGTVKETKTALYRGGDFFKNEYK